MISPASANGSPGARHLGETTGPADHEGATPDVTDCAPAVGARRFLAWAGLAGGGSARPEDRRRAVAGGEPASVAGAGSPGRRWRVRHRSPAAPDSGGAGTGAAGVRRLPVGAGVVSGGATSFVGCEDGAGAAPAGEVGRRFLVWAGLVALAFGIGAVLRAAGALPVDALPPLHARARLLAGPLLPAAVVALAGVAVLPAAARRLRWPLLLGVTWSASAAWAVALQLPDGVARPLTAPTEYLAGLPAMGDDPLGWLRGFTRHLQEYPTHVKGHPPLPMLILWTMRWTGLGGPNWAAALVITAGASATAAIAVTIRAVADEDLARRAVPFVVLAPTAIWVATSMDALFLCVAAWATALTAKAARRGAGGGPRPPWGAIPLLSSSPVDLGSKGFHRLWITFSGGAVGSRLFAAFSGSSTAKNRSGGVAVAGTVSSSAGGEHARSGGTIPALNTAPDPSSTVTMRVAGSTTHSTSPSAAESDSPGTVEDSSQGAAEGTFPGGDEGLSPYAARRSSGATEGTFPGREEGLSSYAARTSPGAAEGTSPSGEEGLSPYAARRSSGAAEGTFPGGDEGLSPYAAGTSPGAAEGTFPGTFEGLPPYAAPTSSGATAGTSTSATEGTSPGATAGTSPGATPRVTQQAFPGGARRSRAGVSAGAWAVAGGVLVGSLPYLSYGLLTIVALPLAVLVIARPRRSVPVAFALGCGIVPIAFIMGGFSWWDGVVATHAAWAAGAGSRRPYLYFLFGDLAVLALVIGPVAAQRLPSVLAGVLPRRGPRGQAFGLLLAAALAGVLALDLSGITRGEVERIWLPYAAWLTAAAAVHRPPARRMLLVQAVTALLIQALVRSPW
jgi:hypothetical protein